MFVEIKHSNLKGFISDKSKYICTECQYIVFIIDDNGKKTDKWIRLKGHELLFIGVEKLKNER